MSVQTQVSVDGGVLMLLLLSKAAGTVAVSLRSWLITTDFYGMAIVSFQVPKK